MRRCSGDFSMATTGRCDYSVGLAFSLDATRITPGQARFTTTHWSVVVQLVEPRPVKTFVFMEDFVREALRDGRAEPEHFRKLVPHSVPSGRPAHLDTAPGGPRTVPVRSMARHKSTDFLQSAPAGRHAADGDRPRSGGSIEMRPRPTGVGISV